MTDIQQKLFKLQDNKYQEFHSRLMPGISTETIIGVRTPAIRNLIRNLSEKEKDEFLSSSLPHSFYEENNLHGFLISMIKDYDICINELNHFLPFVNNWATCDSLRPVCFKRNKQKLLKEIDKWLLSEKTYTIRFAIEMLMVHFLEDDFKKCYLDTVCKIKSNEYYINMMIAWFMATALAKQYESTVTVLENNILPVWVHNKTIQKAIESYRIKKEQKEYLKSLKIT